MGGALSVNEGFFAAFKLASEEMWSNKSIRENVWGFQLQPGTRWNRGLSDGEIREYEAVVDISFPSVFCTYLREMNGTDKPAIDIRGNSGENHRFGSGFYSYPRDMEAIQKMIRHAWADASQLRETLLDEGFCLPDDAKLVPIYSHRFVVCSSRLDAGVVLSIWDSSDAIVYGRSLQEYLEREILLSRSPYSSSPACS